MSVVQLVPMTQIQTQWETQYGWKSTIVEWYYKVTISPLLHGFALTETRGLERRDVTAETVGPHVFVVVERLFQYLFFRVFRFQRDQRGGFDELVGQHVVVHVTVFSIPTAHEHFNKNDEIETEISRKKKVSGVGPSSQLYL